MKLRTIIPAVVVTAISSLLFSTFAVAAAETPKAAEVQADKAGTSPLQPHSHLQEKTGMMPQKKAAAVVADEGNADKPTATAEKPGTPSELKSSSAKTAKVKADKDKSKHFHPRDGK